MSLKSLPQTNDYNVMQQFGTSVFNTVVRWHKLGVVENEYTSEKLVLSAIFLPKIFTIGRNLTKFWQKISLHSFFWDTVYNSLTFCWSTWSSTVFLNCSASVATLRARSCFSFLRASRCSPFGSLKISSRCDRYRFSSAFTASWNFRRKSCSAAWKHTVYYLSNSGRTLTIGLSSWQHH